MYKGRNIANCLEGSARNLYLKNLEYVHEAFGDTEEELIKKRERFCERVAFPIACKRFDMQGVCRSEKCIF